MGKPTGFLEFKRELPKAKDSGERIKDYKEITDTLGKIVQGATPNAKNNATSPMFDALAPKAKKIEKKKDSGDDIDLDSLLKKDD